MKFARPLLAMAFIGASATALAQPSQPDRPARPAAGDFAQHKATILRALATRSQVLAQETGCINAATKPEDLRECREQAQVSREQMGQELRRHGPRGGHPGTGRGEGPRADGQGRLPPRPGERG